MVKTLYSILHRSLDLTKKIILNITHNLSDLKNLKGNYYLIEDFKMIRFTNQTEVIQKYIEG